MGKKTRRRKSYEIKLIDEFSDQSILLTGEYLMFQDLSPNNHLNHDLISRNMEFASQGGKSNPHDSPVKLLVPT